MPQSKIFRIILSLVTAALVVLSLWTLCESLGLGSIQEASSAKATPAEGENQDASSSLSPEKVLPEPPDVDIDSWRFLYAGINIGVGRYSPKLEDVESQEFDTRIAEPVRNFLAAARAQGYTVYIGVGHRNFDYNMHFYELAISEYGNAYEAAKHVFPPGTSEHSTGLAFDITDESFYRSNYADMHDETVEDTEVYQWMAEHCQEYGFIVRYPEGKEEFYGMGCYPGHFRYVGTIAATYIMENDLCLEEFLALYK